MPNGEYWKGALRNGQTGLFKPSETVAYLGAENPAPSLDSKLLKSPANVKKLAKNAQKLPPEKKKLLISEPQGEVLHTCHVGIDGKSFGLLQVGHRIVIDLSQPLNYSVLGRQERTRQSPSIDDQHP